MTAWVRIWRERRLEELVQEFATTVRGLTALADRLAAQRLRQLLEAGAAQASSAYRP